MMPLHPQTSALVLLAGAALFSLSSAAQPAPAPAYRAEREIAITGEADELPAVVYGAPYVPLLLSFDPPLMKDAAVTVQGADVRPHVFLSDTLVITPSKSLAAQRSVPVSVPLTEGVVELTLAFSPPRRDASVRIVRRAASSARPALTGGELEELLSLAASKVLDTGECVSSNATAVPRPIEESKAPAYPGELLVCASAAFAYLHVKANSDCTPAMARLTRGEESAEILLLQAQPAASCQVGSCWLVVARAPHGDGSAFTLELLAEDGVPCQSNLVNLKPSSP